MRLKESVIIFMTLKKPSKHCIQGDWGITHTYSIAPHFKPELNNFFKSLLILSNLDRNNLIINLDYPGLFDDTKVNYPCQGECRISNKRL